MALLRLGRPSGLPPAALGAGFRTGSLRGWVAGFGLSDTGASALLTGRISVSTPRACARYTRTLPASAFPHSPWGTVCGTLPSSLEPSFSSVKIPGASSFRPSPMRTRARQ